MTSDKSKRTLNLLVHSASVASSPAQATCLILGEINSSQLVIFVFLRCIIMLNMEYFSKNYFLEFLDVFLASIHLICRNYLAWMAFGMPKCSIGEKFLYSLHFSMPAAVYSYKCILIKIKKNIFIFHKGRSLPF